MPIDDLVQAVRSLNATDAFRPRWTLEDWRRLAPYLDRRQVRAGDAIVVQGDADRTAYLLEQGSLQVHAAGGPPGSLKIAILRPGALVGEPALFGDSVRMANVEALGPCTLHALTFDRLDALAQRLPALALELLRAAGAVMAARMRANFQRQVPFN